MDTETLRYYQLNAAPVVARYEAVDSPVASRFPLSFPPGSRVLDIGSGSGRDLAALLNENFDARGVEPVAEMRQEALMAHPELAGRLGMRLSPGLSQRLLTALMGYCVRRC